MAATSAVRLKCLAPICCKAVILLTGRVAANYYRGADGRTANRGAGAETRILSPSISAIPRVILLSIGASWERPLGAVIAIQAIGIKRLAASSGAVPTSDFSLYAIALETEKGFRQAGKSKRELIARPNLVRGAVLADSEMHVLEASGPPRNAVSRAVRVEVLLVAGIGGLSGRRPLIVCYAKGRTIFRAQEGRSATGRGTTLNALMTGASGGMNGPLVRSVERSMLQLCIKGDSSTTLSPRRGLWQIASRTLHKTGWLLSTTKSFRRPPPPLTFIIGTSELRTK